MKKPKQESHEPSPASELLAGVAKRLDAQNIAYLLIGGQAVIEHGYVRATVDVDFELALGPWDIEKIRGLVIELGLQPKFRGAFAHAAQSMLLPLVDESRNIGVDFAFSPSEYLDGAIARAPRHEIAGYPVVVAPVEDLLIRKIIANRPRDREDVDQLLLRHGGKLDLSYIETWLERFEQVVDQPLRFTFRDLLQRSRE